MIERIIEQKKILAIVATEYFNCPSLLDINFAILQNILDVLKPFEQLTKTLSKRTESIATIIPSYYTLLHELKKCQQNEKKMRDAIFFGLQTRMNEYLNKE